MAVEIGVGLSGSPDVPAEGVAVDELEGEATVAGSGAFSATATASDLGAAGSVWAGLFAGKALVTEFISFAGAADTFSEEFSSLAPPGN